MLIGRRLSGRYKILEVIGGGGMANVYLARDVILERDVAIKVLRLDFSNDEEFIKRFRREAHAATSLAHPNIVSIYDVGEEEDIYYIVMEYVPGQTLKQYIQRNAPLHPKEAINIMLQLTSAITHAHQNQIVHRDIKPQNILIDHDGTVKVTDFGIAVALSSTTITQTNSVLGSVHYLSPEQARGGMSTRKSDIYSLGIVMFELLTGRVPFEGESAVSIALKHLQTDTPSPKRWNATIPQSVENIILKATAKDPFHRYDTAEEMEEDLQTALFPNRLNEEKFVIPDMDDEVTKAIPIIKDNSPLSTETLVRDSQKNTNQTEKDEPKPKKKKKNRLLVTLAIIFFFIIGAGVAAVTVFPALFLPKDVEVPNVSNMDYDRAVSKLKEAGFTIGDTIEISDQEIQEGYIVRTDPEAGASVKEGAKIDLYESTGKKKVAFKDYIGKDFDEVKAKLDKENYFYVKKEDVFDDSAPGTILKQSIEEGEEVVPEETEVTFTVSKGLETIKLADLTKYPANALDEYSRTTGLNIDYKEEQFSDDIPAGQAISQSPEIGAKLTKGDKVKVIMSKGPEPKKPVTVKRTLTIEYTPDEEGNPQLVKIFIEDADHKITDVYKQMEIKETQKMDINFVINPGETAEYLVYIDNEPSLKEEIQYPEE
ncbi:Stk1 family PASTA domain-containing Ser/Thr kinase [Fredinandcohnia sp. QZ13]|uniref:Stk1 family PASTA domain-containing Ser/Thr kinase n=1 Tax=Fredinandcohnia sp. QZ13 TaxID=3073144 RepID=UPI0028530A65|nr:Stk1 family PASTA domain-containing Ser/Thr kinase [Fredinandcohnia sp. QZ13]MDR4886544.1 Stk1 family PASTA domain-containing Ser/Thr kinase [Fredinandcohnia sp. QZ13]